MKALDGKRVLVMGGTGSLGKVLVRRLLSGGIGAPAKVIVFSRDEAKQYFMRMEYQFRKAATDEIVYRNFRQRLEFRIGDIRDFYSVADALPEADVVFNAVELNRAPTCEYFPYEAVRTNILGAENIVKAIEEYRLPVETVVGISSDRACKPIDALGMTKAIQERIFIQGNLRCPRTRFLCARFSNALASRSSVVPLIQEQIRNGGPVTIATPEMTRFLLSLDDAVDTTFAAISAGSPGETYVPRALSARVVDIATALIGRRKIDIKFTGVRPVEKIHEILISEEEAYRTAPRGKWFAILPMLSNDCYDWRVSGELDKEYSSADAMVSLEETTATLKRLGLLIEDAAESASEARRYQMAGMAG